jgi:Polyketide cyclase / dehydrase and lipid transport
MATIKKEIEVARDRASVWDAVRDVGAIHKRLVRGFVVDCKLEGDSRIVTFANGMVARERIVTVDDRAFRHAWSVQGEPFTHHNGSLEVLALDGGRSRLVWIADLLPDQIAENVSGMMEQAIQAMKRTLENAG